jgi:hypothetical protein
MRQERRVHLDAALLNATLPSAGAAAAALARRSTLAARSADLVVLGLGHRKLLDCRAGSMSAFLSITQRCPGHYTGGAPVYCR